MSGSEERRGGSTGGPTAAGEPERGTANHARGDARLGAT